MASVNTLLSNPEMATKYISDAIYTRFHEVLVEKLMGSLKAEVEDIVTNELKSLKVAMENDYFQKALLVKVFLNNEELK